MSTEETLPQAPSPLATGQETSLSPWVGDYVVDMLGRGRAAASQPYTAYTGPLTAGESGLQQQAYYGEDGTGGLGSLSIPTGMGDAFSPMSFTGTLDQQYNVTDPSTGAQMLDGSGNSVTNDTVAGQYMNPYLQSSLSPQIAELRRQQEISRLNDASRLTEAGAYGGSRQAIMEAEGNRNLLTQIDRTQSQGYKDAYDKARAQFNTEQAAARDAQIDANRYGFDVLAAQQGAGAEQRGILGQGIAADQQQFMQERDYPLKSAQYMQSLLQGLPMEATSKQFAPVNPLQAGIAGAAGGASTLDKILEIFGI